MNSSMLTIQFYDCRVQTPIRLLMHAPKIIAMYHNIADDGYGISLRYDSIVFHFYLELRMYFEETDVFSKRFLRDVLAESIKSDTLLFTMLKRIVSICDYLQDEEALGRIMRIVCDFSFEPDTRVTTARWLKFISTKKYLELYIGSLRPESIPVAFGDHRVYTQRQRTGCILSRTNRDFIPYRILELAVQRGIEINLDILDLNYKYTKTADSNIQFGFFKTKYFTAITDNYYALVKLILSQVSLTDLELNKITKFIISGRIRDEQFERHKELLEHMLSVPEINNQYRRKLIRTLLQTKEFSKYGEEYESIVNQFAGKEYEPSLMIDLSRIK